MRFQLLLVVATFAVLAFAVGVFLNARRRRSWSALGLKVNVPLHPLFGAAKAEGTAHGRRVTLLELDYGPNKHRTQLLTFFASARELPLIEGPCDADSMREGTKTGDAEFDAVFRVVGDGPPSDALRAKLRSLLEHASVKYVALAPVGLTLTLHANETAEALSELVDRSADTLKTLGG